MEFTIELFRNTYPEFTVEQYPSERIEATYLRIACLYPIVYDTACKGAIAACMLVAHYLTVEAQPDSYGQLGMQQSSGAMLSSASVGGVSIATQTAPVKDMLEYFMGSTKYGLEYLAFVAVQGGLRYVN